MNSTRFADTSLLHRFLPEHQFSEQHQIRIDAAPGRVLDMVSRLDISDFPLAKLFLHLRAVPARLAALAGKHSERRVDAGFGLHDFIKLGRDGDRELALGLVGKFWEPDELVSEAGRSCLAPFAGLPPIMPVFSSGQWAGHAPQLHRALGSMDRIKKGFAVLLGLAGLAILLGWDKQLESWALDHLPDAWLRLSNAL